VKGNTFLAVVVSVGETSKRCRKPVEPWHFPFKHPGFPVERTEWTFYCSRPIRSIKLIPEAFRCVTRRMCLITRHVTRQRNSALYNRRKHCSWMTGRTLWNPTNRVSFVNFSDWKFPHLVSGEQETVSWLSHYILPYRTYVSRPENISIVVSHLLMEQCRS
jgi:hypothetical protein